MLFGVFSDTNSFLSSSRCFYVKVKPGYGRDVVFLLWDRDPDFLRRHLRQPRAPLGRFHQALWNFDHLISTLHCQSLRQNYKDADKMSCLPFSSHSCSLSLDVLAWMSEWEKVNQPVLLLCSRYRTRHKWALGHFVIPVAFSVWEDFIPF